MGSLAERMLGAARLDPATYEEVEADTAATGQAALVVVLSSVCMALGTVGTAAGAVVGLTALRLAGWFVWAFITYVVGTRLLPGQRTEADLGQMLRTLGFATAPGVVGLLALIPGLAGIVGIVVSAWMLAAMVIAVRQALDYERTARAIGVVVIGFVAYLLVAGVVGGMLFGTPREAG